MPLADSPRRKPHPGDPTDATKSAGGRVQLERVSVQDPAWSGGWLVALAVLATVLCSTMAWAWMHVPRVNPFPFVLLAAAMCGAILSAVTSRLGRPRVGERTMPVELDDEELNLGLQRVPRSAVKRARFRALPDGTGQLTLEARWQRPHAKPSELRSIVLTPEAAQARELAEALGHPPTDPPTEAKPDGAATQVGLSDLDLGDGSALGQRPTTSRVGLGVVGLFAPAAAMAATSSGPERWLFAALALWCLTQWVGQATRHGAAPLGAAWVAADGLYARWGRDVRFVPIAEVDSAQATLTEEGGDARVATKVALRDGKHMELVLRGGRGRQTATVGDAEVRAEVLARRVNAAVKAHRERVGTPARRERTVGLLERGDRSVDEWLEGLRGLASEARSFRNAAGGLETVWDVLERPDSLPQHRAAAAAALAPALDGEGRRRLRVAAELSSVPKVRVALEAAAEGDDAALRAALEDLELESASEAAEAE
jgi:hypothetical protein